MSEIISIRSGDYWIRVIEMCRQEWALIEPTEQGVTVYFLSDNSSVFDEIAFDSGAAAELALRRNMFFRFAEEPEAASFLRCPASPFTRCPHAGGPIYSSGRFWKSA
jgi:hypothetical protein